jgi:hypothetical protein
MSHSDSRFRLGAAVLVVSFLAPAFIPLVTASGLPPAWKTTIAGLLAAGIPEIGMVASVAIMGKDGFARFKGMLGRWLAPIAPPDHVSATRYRIGLALLAVPLALAWLGPYFGHHLPAYESHQLVYAIGGDVMLLTSFFVLGGEFWDKLRALFTQDVRVVPATALPREE